MPSEVILPRVDMDMATGKIAKWFVEPGARVSKGQPLFEIETDKAAMEIEAPASGIVRDLAEASTRDIPVGSIVAWIDADGEVSPSLVASPPVAEGGVRATPLARRLARERAIDLASLAGSGPQGRIQARDVEQAASQGRFQKNPDPVAEADLSGQADRGHPEAAPAPATEPSFTAPAAAPPAGEDKGSVSAGLIRLRQGMGAPILLIHGFGAEAAGWRPFLGGLRLDRPVYALDLPGHGATPLGAAADFSGLVDAAQDLVGAADLAGVTLVGHSLGGAVAAALVARGALDVRSLLLIAPAGLGPGINGDFLHGYLGAASEASLRPWLHELVVEPGVITPAFLRASLKAREAPGLVAGQRRLAAALFPDGTQSFSIRADLGRFRIPTRIVFGAADRIIPAKQAQGLPGRVALHLFPNVGHMPHLEVREDVAEILLQTIS